MKQVEYLEQVKLFEWARLYTSKHNCLKWLNSSQNGVRITNYMGAVRAKKAGMSKGFPDIFLPYPTQSYAGLFIELKRPIIKGQSKPIVSKEQKEWLEYLNSVNYKAVVCYGANEAIQTICDYIA